MKPRKTKVANKRPKENVSASKEPLRIEAIILAGGLGTRLKSIISDKQKVIAPIKGTPVLEIIIKSLLDQNVGRIILCVGYMKEGVIRFIKEASTRDHRFSLVEFSEEEIPLGTGGAIKKATQLIHGEDCIILNGDTLNKIDIHDFYKFHKKSKNLASIAVAKDVTGDGGRINVDATGRVISFNEKSGEGQYANAGIYAINKEMFSHMPDGHFSIEMDFFPKALTTFALGAYKVKNFIDIGTPERYRKANETLDF